MQRRWLIATMVTVVWGGGLAVMLRERSQDAIGADSTENTAAAPSSAKHASQGQRARNSFDATVRTRRRASRAAPAGPVPSQRLGVGAGIQRITESPEFTEFVASVRIDDEQQDTLAHILALHYENERTLSVSAPEPELAQSMQRQLLHDTRAQVRARVQMNDEIWESFERSGLLSAPPEARGEASAAERNPT